ncbi:hypothetical protein [Bounagaea algeriensis]
MTRRYGLMGQGKATRMIAVLLVFGLAAGFGLPHLSQAGVPMWLVLVLAMLLVGLPVYAVARAERR